MKLIYEKFKQNKAKYIVQCALATLSVLCVLIVLSSVTDAVIVASLGASSFIVFTMPKAHVSSPRLLIGGYLIGTIVGCSCYFLAGQHLITNISIIHEHSREIFGAISVGIAILLMVITGSAHPPAAGLALGFVLNGWNYITVTVVIVGIVLISTIKLLLKGVLINLLDSHPIE